MSESLVRMLPSVGLSSSVSAASSFAVGASLMPVTVTDTVATTDPPASAVMVASKKSDKISSSTSSSNCPFGS